MRRILLVVCFVMASAGPTLLRAADTITTGSLVQQMVDMVSLAEFPQPAYKTVQFSSHDHRSTIPGGPNWFANSDGFGREPIPNFEAIIDPPNEDGVGRYLICDVKGPGAIVRTWTAAIEGHIRMYLDGADQPVFDGAAQQFMQALYEPYADAAKLPRDLFVGAFRQRDACYFPIPFAHSCRIEWIGNVQRIHFYEVQVRKYDHSADIQTFKAKDCAAFAKTIRQVAAVLKSPNEQWQYRSKQEPATEKIDLKAHATALVAELNEPAAIERFRVRLQATDSVRALRQTLLRIVFDDHQDAQVQCPVGDFFGAAPGINPFDAVPFTVAPDGTMTSRYVMPFQKSCKIWLENRGDQPVRAAVSYLPLDYQWNPDRSMHFRARWRVDHDLVSEGGAGAQDLPFVVARGKGVYVGTTIILLNPNPVPTPAGNWWGEGDEKIFFDDDARPAIFGTGSEDYFNYSWSSPDIFLFPYCGQPRNDGPANRGFVVNQRWHILDALPFQTHLAFYMELFSHERNPNFSYARIGYHYGRPGMVDDFVRLTDEDIRPLRLPDWQPAARGAARNSTFYQAESIVQHSADAQLVASDLASGRKLLQWRPSGPTDTLQFDIPVAKTGKYVIHITAAQTPDAGTLVATLDGKPLPFATTDGRIALQTAFRTQLRNSSTRVLELATGKHRLGLRAVAAVDESGSARRPTIGIDFIWVQARGER